MKITDERTSNKVEFQTIDIGDVFRWENDVFMKTPRTQGIRQTGLIYNAVRLDLGDNTLFANGDLVEPLDVELVIRG